MPDLQYLRMFSARCGLLCLILSLPLVAQSQANASSPDLSQEAFVLERWNESVRFENEGSGVRGTTAVIRIQSQAGVREFGQLVFGIGASRSTSRAKS